MAPNGMKLLVWGAAALLAGFLAESGLAASPGFTVRVEPPPDMAPGLTVSPSLGESDGLSFATRLGGVASSFSIDHSATGRTDIMPRMRWSRPLGATLAGARFSSDGWSLDFAAGYGGDENPSGSALLQPGSARGRSGWSTALEYDFGPWQLGGYYQFTRSDMGFTPAGQVESAYGLGANYTVAPGLSLFSEAFFYTEGLGRAPLAATQGGGTGNSSLKSQSGKLYVIGTHLEW